MLSVTKIIDGIIICGGGWGYEFELSRHLGVDCLQKRRDIIRQILQRAIKNRFQRQVAACNTTTDTCFFIFV